MKYNFSERIKIALVNFGRGRSDDEWTIGSDEDDLSIYKAGLLKDKNSKEYNDAFLKVISSHADLQAIGADSDFKSRFKTAHEDDGEYKKFYDLVDKSVKAKELANKNSNINIARDKAKMEAMSDLGSAIVDSMESPAKEFFQGMFKFLMNAGVNIAKIKQLKDDETGFDLNKEITDAANDPEVVDKASQKSGVPVESGDGSSSTSSSGSTSSSESLDDSSTTEEDARSPEEFMKDILPAEHTLTSSERVRLQKGLEEGKVPDKFIKEYKKNHPQSRLFKSKNFSERIHRYFN